MNKMGCTKMGCTLLKVEYSNHRPMQPVKAFMTYNLLFTAHDFFTTHNSHTTPVF